MFYVKKTIKYDVMGLMLNCEVKIFLRYLVSSNLYSVYCFAYVSLVVTSRHVRSIISGVTFCCDGGRNSLPKMIQISNIICAETFYIG